MGLRSYKKGYYIKENELTGFENIVKSEYPELGYNICRSSKKASITVYEKEKEDVLFHATLKNNIKQIYANSRTFQCGCCFIIFSCK